MVERGELTRVTPAPCSRCRPRRPPQARAADRPRRAVGPRGGAAASWAGARRSRGARDAVDPALAERVAARARAVTGFHVKVAPAGSRSTFTDENELAEIAEALERALPPRR